MYGIEDKSREQMAQRKILLGRIIGAHGLKGDVLISAYASAPENLSAYGTLSDEAGERSFTIDVRRVTPKGVVAGIDGIKDRTAAEALRGIGLYVDRNRLPEAAEDEYYQADLIGLMAVNPDGTPLGTVVSVQNYGAGDLIEIAVAGSRRTELIPFTDAFVPDIDTEAGKMVVRLPVGDSTPQEE
jgi:16S rRNA processing protein RimM